MAPPPRQTSRLLLTVGRFSPVPHWPVLGVPRGSQPLGAVLVDVLHRQTGSELLPEVPVEVLRPALLALPRVIVPLADGLVGLPVPANDGLRLNDMERLAPPHPPLREPRPEEAIEF